MSDQVLDTKQLINGVAVLLSFYVGYKYGTSNSKLQTSNSKLQTTSNSNVRNPLNLFRQRDCKMLLVVRNDLKMGKGKIAAQCGHAAVGAYQKAQRKCPELLEHWENSGCAKIAVKVESEEELMGIKRIAEKRNFNTSLIRDAGRTQIEPNTKTVLAIGPAICEELDQITGHLKLL